MIVSIRALPQIGFVFAAALALALGGCGGDDEDEPADHHRGARPRRPAETTATDGPPSRRPGDRDAARRRRRRPAPGTAPPHPRASTGGAGDEEPAQTLALFTGRERADHAARGPGAGVHLDPRGAALRRRQRVRADASASKTITVRDRLQLGVDHLRRPAAGREAGRRADRRQRQRRCVIEADRRSPGPQLTGWPASVRYAAPHERERSPTAHRARRLPGHQRSRRCWSPPIGAR